MGLERRKGLRGRRMHGTGREQGVEGGKEQRAGWEGSVGLEGGESGDRREGSMGLEEKGAWDWKGARGWWGRKLARGWKGREHGAGRGRLGLEGKGAWGWGGGAWCWKGSVHGAGGGRELGTGREGSKGLE